MVFLFTKFRLLGYVSMLGLLAVQMLTVFLIADRYDVGVNMINDQGALGKYLYFKPWARCGVYMVGVIFGFLYWEYKNPAQSVGRIGPSLGDKLYNLIRYSWIFRTILFVIGLALTTFITFIPQKEIAAFTERVWSQAACNIYNTFSLWGI